MKTEIGRCVDKCKEEFFIPSDAVDQGIHNDYQFTIRDSAGTWLKANGYIVWIVSSCINISCK